MRKFSSYGSIDPEFHYYVPRQKLIDEAIQQLKGDNPNKGGHYITVWAPRQTGKTWIMEQVFFKLQQHTQFDVVFLPLQHLCDINDVNDVAQVIAQELREQLHLENLSIQTFKNFHLLFKRDILSKPLILIFDEFDTLSETIIVKLVSVFRNIYHHRRLQTDKHTAEKSYLLHSVALIGVRAALGVENVTGSPFNIQRNVYIPNLTQKEVIYLFNEYQQESFQSIEPEVVERIWYEFQGQPGLTCWFGELLTQTYNQTTKQPITQADFNRIYTDALDLLPNNNILNIISKAKQEAYKPFVLELFQTETKIPFIYRDPIINFLYMNGVISVEKANLGENQANFQASLGENYVKFSCPYVQKQLFSYFARELYHEEMLRLYDPLEDLSDTITDDSLNIPQLLRRYERHLQANRDFVLKNAPRRADLRVHEAVFHFHFYLYLVSFFRSYKAQVQPEFPTGNGAIDLLIRHAGHLFGLELKSFAGKRQYRDALIQAATYGKQLGMSSIWLVLFIETIDETNRQQFEADYTDSETGVIVHPFFVQTGVAKPASPV